MNIQFSQNGDSLLLQAELTNSSDSEGVFYCQLQITSWASSESTSYDTAESALEISFFNKTGFNWTGNCTYCCHLPGPMTEAQTYSYLVREAKKYGWVIERM